MLLTFCNRYIIPGKSYIIHTFNFSRAGMFITQNRSHITQVVTLLAFKAFKVGRCKPCYFLKLV